MNQIPQKQREKRGSILKNHSSFGKLEQDSSSVNEAQIPLQSKKPNESNILQKSISQQKNNEQMSDAHAETKKHVTVDNKVTFGEGDENLDDLERPKKVLMQNKLTSSGQDDIRRPSQDLGKLSEAELVKLCMRTPSIWEDEEDSDNDETQDNNVQTQKQEK